MKKTFSLIAAVLLTATMLSACSDTTPTPFASPPASVTPEPQMAKSTLPPSPEPVKPISKVGIAMPTKDLQRWHQDGENMKFRLEKEGFKVNLQYANNETDTQVSQIENMILGGCQVLVIASVDGSALGGVLADAKTKGITVIAYDRLIMESDAVSYYASFDNYMVGTLQGTYIKDALELDTAEGPSNMEVFAGSPDEHSGAEPFYQGAMDVLNPFIKSGKLVIVSGVTEFEKVNIPGWRSEAAQTRMDNLITANYATGKKLDAVLSPNDSIAIGIVNALDKAGYGTEDKPYPILTGQDCDITIKQNMGLGKQSMSVFKETRDLSDKVVEMIVALRDGKEVPVNDTTQYNNGKIIVPSYLCEPIVVSRKNMYEYFPPDGCWGNWD